MNTEHMEADLKYNERLVAELLEACQNALGAYGALKTIGADKALPGYEHCLSYLKETIRKANLGESDVDVRDVIVFSDEATQLETTNAELLETLEGYAKDHDDEAGYSGILSVPCKCNLCKRATEAIRKAKGAMR